MATYGVAEAKNNFTHLLDRVQAGESITITRHGKPIAELRAAPKLTLEERQARWAELMARPIRQPRPGLSAVEVIRKLRDGEEL
ncbi:MAG: type II toxin-antitoxin system prevent-host-death family antitoxin [Brevundimonas sp.]|uniref:type II toxin-antitoxin system Phd/YefM family antitoxin n=1 Tax=Brevundimonas sp. TaxID=1871086 RepID=UPI0027345983|nr:type II toxin-antitoxin system prevent-host-death family antitoxin [Brevundimonas sp.]MDP3404400.1 type II toxin-antitoxin system prevent-host-death family antitoxin [Brevundimonas sp.]